MSISSNLTELKHWSCWGKYQKDLPPVSQIKAIHIYDFDNTLFLSSLPNPKLWTQQSVSYLKSQDAFAHGGWWQDNRFLEATGKGMDVEESRAWQGWWNEDIVKLVELSILQGDALTVLLTGRGERKFADIIRRMVLAKKLDFNMVCLKPPTSHDGRPFSSTAVYKQTLIKDLIANYSEIDELKMYEDRPKHTEMFTDFLNNVNLDLIRGEFPSARRTPFTAEVIQVPHRNNTLDPVMECAAAQKIVNDHNATNPNPRLQIKRTVFFTGYMLSQNDADKLVTLLDPNLLKSSDIKVLANNIVITPKPATQSVLAKVGGLGSKQIWQVVATGSWNEAIYAAKVTPIPSSAVVFVESSQPMVVLATLRGAKAADSQRIVNWQPVDTDKQFVFETTVSEKVQLRIDAETEGESEYDSLFPRPYGYHASAQKRRGDDYERPGRDDRRVSNGFRGGRGGRDRDRDRIDRRDRFRDSGVRGGRGGNGAARGDRNDRGSQRKHPTQRNHAYRSLDDMSRNDPGDHARENGRPGPESAAERYNTNFPALGSGSSKPTGGGYDGADDGGLHY